MMFDLMKGMKILKKEKKINGKLTEDLIVIVFKVVKTNMFLMINLKEGV